MLTSGPDTGLHRGERPQLSSVRISFSGTGGQRLVSTRRIHVGQRLFSSVTASAAASGHVSDSAAFTGPQAILDRYHALLHEYHQHKVALADWLSHITRTKHRKAQLLDAEATGDAALISRFQQYLMIKKRLLAEIPLMREQLEAAEQQQPHYSSSSREQQHKRHHSKAKHSSTSSTGSYGVVNANQASPVSKTQAVGQFFAAVNYRNKHGGRDSSGSAVEQPAVQEASQLQPAPAAAPASPAAATSAASSSASSAAASSSSSSSSSIKAEALSHLLSAATNSSNASSSSSSSSSACSGRATAAALAALAYKKQKQLGGVAAGTSSLGPQQQRPLAVQLAEPPPPPPGYAADGRRLDGSSSSNVVIGVVETAKADANALRSYRQLETDVSLEATLQGVPGGLGASDSAMFAATITRPAADAVISSSSSSTDLNTAAMDPVLAAAAAQASSSGSSAPVGEVVTAKFDVYSGRQRVLDTNALDVYFASLADGHSMQLAAAAAASSSTSNATDNSTSSTVQQQVSPISSSDGKGSQQKASRREVSNSSSSEGSLVGGLGLPGDIIPLPT